MNIRASAQVNPILRAPALVNSVIRAPALVNSIIRASALVNSVITDRTLESHSKITPPKLTTDNALVKAPKLWVLTWSSHCVLVSFFKLSFITSYGCMCSLGLSMIVMKTETLHWCLIYCNCMVSN